MAGYWYDTHLVRWSDGVLRPVGGWDARSCSGRARDRLEGAGDAHLDRHRRQQAHGDPVRGQLYVLRRATSSPTSRPRAAISRRRPTGRSAATACELWPDYRFDRRRPRTAAARRVRRRLKPRHRPDLHARQLGRRPHRHGLDGRPPAALEAVRSARHEGRSVRAEPRRSPALLRDHARSATAWCSGRATPSTASAGAIRRTSRTGTTPTSPDGGLLRAAAGAAVPDRDGDAATASSSSRRPRPTSSSISACPTSTRYNLIGNYNAPVSGLSVSQASSPWRGSPRTASGSSTARPSRRSNARSSTGCSADRSDLTLPRASAAVYLGTQFGGWWFFSLGATRRRTTHYVVLQLR